MNKDEARFEKKSDALGGLIAVVIAMVLCACLVVGYYIGTN